MKDLIKGVFKGTKKLNCNSTSVKLKGDYLTIDHIGQWGHTVSNINNNLIKLKLPSISTLKQKFDIITEYGSEDCAWGIEVKI